jgi:checkpoint serine/threonine-protein kinase
MNEPTMTLTTKEAWGDIMSMFSGGLDADRATNPAETDAAAAAALAPVRESNTPGAEG